jgi:hypothetical protein
MQTVGVKDQGNGIDPFPPLPRNPVVKRDPLADLVDPLSEKDFEGPIGQRLASTVGAVVTRIDQLGEDLSSFSRAAFQAFERGDKRADAVTGQINELKVLLATGQALPPMRAESPSSHAVTGRASDNFEEKVRRKARETPGGAGVVQAPVEEIVADARKSFAEQMAEYEERKRVEAALKAQADAAAAKVLQQAEDKQRRAERRNFWALTISASIAAVVGALSIYFVTKASEHEKGFTEGLRAAPTATVVVAAAPEESASSVRAFAPSAPAAVAPHAPAK